jgi:hypothetical protein
LGICERDRTHLSIVRRHASFVNFFDAVSSRSIEQHSRFVQKVEKVRTIKVPSDFYHVWERHAGSKVETDKFDDQSLDG